MCGPTQRALGACEEGYVDWEPRGHCWFAEVKWVIRLDNDRLGVDVGLAFGLAFGLAVARGNDRVSRFLRGEFSMVPRYIWVSIRDY